MIYRNGCSIIIFTIKNLRGAEQMDKETFIKIYLNMTAEQREAVRKVICSFQIVQTYRQPEPSALVKDDGTFHTNQPLQIEDAPLQKDSQ